jgi:hypothetical protein
MIRSISYLSVFALVIFGIHFGVFHLLQLEFRPVMGMLYAFMIGLHLLFDLVLTREKKPQRFVNYYMGFSGGKLMLSLFTLLLYGLYDPEYLKPFAGSFLGLYFSFTAFEIARLLRHLKN